MKIQAIAGDITGQEVDAVVNAANSTLLGGGGVDGAIHKAGGPSILQECRAIRSQSYPDGLPVGMAVATGAGDLPAKWVIHTVGPIYAQSSNPEDELASCYSESLRVADEIGAYSVAFPAISAGAYGYPIDEAAPIAVDAVASASTQVEDVTFVLFNEGFLKAFRIALEGSLAGGATDA